METSDLILLGVAGVGIFYFLNKKEVDTSLSPGAIFTDKPNLITPLPNYVIKYFKENPTSIFNPAGVFTENPNVITPLPNAVIDIVKSMPPDQKEELAGLFSINNAFTSKANIFTPIPSLVIDQVQKASIRSKVKKTGSNTSYSPKSNTLTVSGLKYSVAPENAVSMAKSLNTPSVIIKKNQEVYSKVNINPYKAYMK